MAEPWSSSPTTAISPPLQTVSSSCRTAGSGASSRCRQGLIIKERANNLALPAGLAQTIEHARVVLRPYPRCGLTDTRRRRWQTRPIGRRRWLGPRVRPGDAAPVLGDLGVDQLTAVRLQPHEGPFLVGADQPAVARDIRGKSGDQPAFDAFSCQAGRSLTAGPNRFVGSRASF